MGGEISWNCDSSGNYIFDVHVYRDCSGANIPPRGTLDVHNYPSAGMVVSFTLSQLSGKEFAPYCRGGGPYSCLNGDDEAIFYYHLQTNPVQLNGVPPSSGWVLTYSDNARNFNDNLVGQAGITLRAKMFDFPGRDSTCFDVSPRFVAPPVSVTLSGEPFDYNPHANDPNLDSISYEWAKPLNGINGLFVQGVNPSPVPFQNGYSHLSPFPGPTQNPQNVVASLNQNSGSISLENHISGKYVAVVKATSFSCGIRTAEIFREYQFNFVNPSVTNNSPTMQAPFLDGSGSFTSWQDTVVVGSLVSFNLNVIDLPVGTATDSVYLFAHGLQFGDSLTNPNFGCLAPPCAALNKQLPSRSLIGNNVTFSWQTAPSHLIQADSCQNLLNTYSFVFVATDDKCPIPKRTERTVSITVIDSSIAGGGTNTRLNDLSTKNEIRLFPNPTKGLLTLDSPNRRITSIVLRNIQGKVLSREANFSNNPIQLNIEQNAGLYLLEIIDEDGNRAIQKVVKQ